MIKYMNGSVFSKAKYMNGVGFEILARTPVPKLLLSPPPTPRGGMGRRGGGVGGGGATSYIRHKTNVRTKWPLFQCCQVYD